VNLADLAANTANAIVDGPFGSNLKTSHYTESGPRVIRLQNIGDGHFEDERAHISIEHFSRHERHHEQPDDLLVAALGEELPRACLVPHWLGPALVKADCPRIRLNNEISIPEFVCHWLNSSQCRDRAAAIIHGVGRPRMNLAEIRGLWVPIAHPLEQAATAAKVEALFSELDAGVAQLEAAQALLKRFRQSVLKAAFEGRLTAEWREQRRMEAEANGEKLPTAQDLLKQIEAERQERAEQQHAVWHEAVRAWEAAGGKDSGEKKPRKPAKPKDPPPLTEEELESLPEGWCWVALDGLVDGKRSSAYGVLQPGPDTPNGIPFVRVGDLVDGDIPRGSLKHIQPAISEKYPRTLLDGREVLISLVGTVGRSAVVPKELAGANVARALAVIPLTPSVTPRFVEMQYRQVSKAAQLTAEAHEVARKTLNLEDLKKSPTIVAPIEEQVVIVEEVERRLSTVNQIASEIDNALASAVALRQSILKRAFEGRLLDEAELEAVRSDPDYEPAEKLLERIRAHAEASKKTKTPTKKKTTRKKRIARKTQETT